MSLLFGPTRISAWSTIVYLYIGDLADEIDRQGVNFHAYADDSQLYVHCNRFATASTAARLELCITDIGHWMSGVRKSSEAQRG